MFIIGNFLYSLGIAFNLFMDFEMTMIVIGALLSWIRPMLYSYKFDRIFFGIEALSSIVLRPLRKIIPPIGMIDITPMIGFMALVFLKNFVGNSLIQMGLMLR
jgi:YggT family protein